MVRSRCGQIEYTSICLSTRGGKGDGGEVQVFHSATSVMRATGTDLLVFQVGERVP